MFSSYSPGIISTMGHHCCGPHHTDEHTTSRYRRALWFALAVNVAMLVVEIAASWKTGSVSLLADAVDFFGDAANYAVSLAVFSLGHVWRTRTAMLKGASMAGFGLFVLSRAAWTAVAGGVPDAKVMGFVAVLALVANGTVAAVLYTFRDGDADMRSVWLCSRNDAIGNLAVLLAAFGVFGTGTGWPDLLVAAVMGLLALSSARSVIVQARGELRGRDSQESAPAPSHHH